MLEATGLDDASCQDCRGLHLEDSRSPEMNGTSLEDQQRKFQERTVVLIMYSCFILMFQLLH